MIPFAALILLQIAVPAASPDSDVVVTARKLSNLDIVLKRQRGGGYYCKYRRRSGDESLDAAACAAAIGCFAKAESRDGFKTCVTSAVTILIGPKSPPN